MTSTALAIVAPVMMAVLNSVCAGDAHGSDGSPAGSANRIARDDRCGSEAIGAVAVLGGGILGRACVLSLGASCAQLLLFARGEGAGD